MTVTHKDTFTCYFLNSETEKTFESKEAALSAAKGYCGNNRWIKPFPREETYMFGPGDGTTSVMVRQDITFTGGENERYPN